MRIHFKLLSLVAAVVAAGCQVYDFKPVEPLAISQTTQAKTIRVSSKKPNLMLLVDKSGSMDLPINAGASGCGTNCGTGSGNPICNPTTCDTRWTELQDAMNAFLTASGSVARMGLTYFPGN